MKSGTFPQSSAIALPWAIFVLISAVGCGRMATPQFAYNFKTPVLESQLATYGKALQDNGLTAQEAEIIVNRARTEVNSSSWQIASDLAPQIRAMAGMVNGSIKALGKTSFSESDERKLLAMELIARLTLESGSEQLAELSESETQEVITVISEGQILSAPFAYMASNDSLVLAYQAMTDSVLNALETTAIPVAYHTSVSEKVATSTVSHLDETGLPTTAIQALIPILVGNAVNRIANSATGSDQNSMIVEFIASTLAQINDLGLSPAQISSIKSGITTESTLSLQNSPISSSLANQIIGDISTTIESSEPPPEEPPPEEPPPEKPTPPPPDDDN